jgi:cyanophycinase-like exopeptidase
LRRLPFLVRTALFALLLCFPGILCAQSCSLCRDTTAGSAPRARQGLRRGIVVLGTAAGAVFVTNLLVARNAQPRESSEPKNDPL